jgi:hypothetical protein
MAFAILVTSAVATDPAPALNDISTYTWCSAEGQSFALSAPCDVAYGANGKFVFKAAQCGTVTFNGAAFGDPIQGVAKAGYYRFAFGLQDISTYTKCANEWESFTLPRMCDVAYGANGKFVFKPAQSGTVVFNNATFGDPISGVAKAGYYRLPLCVAGNGTGLTGDYADQKGARVRRLDSSIDFAWGFGSPDPSIAVDYFRARWSGQIQTRYDGECTLSILSDDRVSVYLDGKQLINDVTGRTSQRENICTFTSLAGQKHDLRIDFIELTSVTGISLRWKRGSEAFSVVPTACLYPYDVASVLPASSTVSPAFIEGFYGVTLPTLNVGTVSDLGETRFYGNIPLSATAATSVTLIDGSTTATRAITWTPTLLTNGASVVVRPGDALLLKATSAGNMIINKGYAAFRANSPIAAGQAIPVTFSEPGTYTILENDAAGNRLVEMTVRVPGVVAEAAPIACAVDFARVKDLTLVGAADKDLITWSASDPWMLVAPVAVASAPATQVRLTIKPTWNWAVRLVGRINGENGAILSSKVVRPFTLMSLSQKVINGIQRFSDGSLLCETGLVMTPLVPGLDIEVKVISGGVSFDDSSLVRWANTQAFVDNGTGAKWIFRLIKAPGAITSVCHSWVTYQNGVQVSR